MNSTLFSKVLYALVALLVATTAYLLIQQRALKNELALNNEQCQSRFSALFDAMEKGIPANVQVKLTKDAAPASVVGVKTAALVESIEPADPNDEKPKLERFNESLGDIVKRKYRFLFAKLDLSPAEREELMQLLLRREQIHLQIKDAEEFSDEIDVDEIELTELRFELEDIDYRIQQILGSEDNREQFALLKESDNEQKEFNQFTLGINGLFPLNRDQQETVLITRLRHKQKFEKELAATGFDQNFPLTQTQQEEIMGKIEDAAHRYKEGFLDDVRPQLEHDNFPMDQYTLLENYTNTEFETLLESIKTRIDERGWIPE